ncbi:MAG: type I-U CRISPR-associated RAMP protein Csb1/Cas7u [Bryobacteraceae bacterium]|nr:type I-U CRISPR-associated RAMP protein Csb1/Cas7u [Bryobacteraceae bacterium]MDW8378827.1 type I-U CRISPR-associated RAMP protein Csb1/Cas7u [Bryobacterales bacterium]
MTSDTNILSDYDGFLRDEADIAAIVIRERLRPVQGPRGVFFPPTFAAIGQGKKSDYHIDRIGPLADDPERAARDGVIANRCTVDSVPSQANRLENRLLRYSGKYIPKVSISGSRVGEQSLDLLEVGHRVADAVLRYTADNGYEPFRAALRAFVAGDAAPLARLAPTSLVFGHWDSRPGGTKSKARRILRSEIVAYNVARVTKRSQYWSSIDPEVNEELGQILAEAKEAASRDPETKNPASQLGMTDVPAPESPGGVIAFGKIERTSMIALSGLRSLTAFPAPTSAQSEASAGNANAQVIDPDQTLALRRYLFALSLAAVVDPGAWDLREGCILVRNGPPPSGDLSDGETPITATLVRFNGEEQSFTLPSPADVEAYLEAATDAFFQNGLPKATQLTFAPKLAYAAVAEPKTKKDFVERLAALQDYAGKEAELKQMDLRKLKKLWQEKQAPAAGPEDSGGSGGDSSPTEP